MTEHTQKEIVERLVADRRLSHAEGDELLRAPRVVLSFRETVGYLAAAIIAVGVVRLAVALFDEASDVLIATLLYVVSGAAGFIAYRMEKKSGWRLNTGEILEVASIGAFVAAGAVLLANADVEGPSFDCLRLISERASRWCLQRSPCVPVPSNFSTSIRV
jgi:hypothetical protein